jgi:hypothetical protein
MHIMENTVEYLIWLEVWRAEEEHEHFIFIFGDDCSQQHHQERLLHTRIFFWNFWRQTDYFNFSNLNANEIIPLELFLKDCGKRIDYIVSNRIDAEK